MSLLSRASEMVDGVPFFTKEETERINRVHREYRDRYATDADRNPNRRFFAPWAIDREMQAKIRSAEQAAGVKPTSFYK